MIANKSDLDPDPEEVETLEELLGLRFPAMTVSAKTGEGLDELGPFLFRALEIVRVYTKTPGKPADGDKPFTVRRGGTVHDVANGLFDGASHFAPCNSPLAPIVKSFAYRRDH